MLSVMYGRSIFSSVFAMGDSSAIGLYDFPSVLSLLGFGMGTVFAVFQIIGMMFVLSDMLYMCVSSAIALGPRCFRCLMFMLSGPVELLFFESLIACFVCSSVMCMCSVGSPFVLRSIFLFVFRVWCFMVLMNCLLKCSAFCLLVMAVLLLKVIVVFGVSVGFLFRSPDIVFQSLCWSCLWSQLSVRCCFHRSSLCCCICWSISLFFCGRSGCWWFCCLSVFLSCISVRMCSGSILCLGFIFPLGMLCLSAVSIAFVIILLSVCTLFVGCMLSSMFSISCVNSSQRAFL